MTNPCETCGGDIPVVDGRSKRRKHCSLECKNASRRQQVAPHVCACGCGEHPKNAQARYVAGHQPLQPLGDRLWSRVLKLESGCWEWQGFRHPTRGYGQMGRGRKSEGLVETHRAAWELTYGPIPEGMFVCHRCDNPPCCNPDHLFLGTAADNVADMVDKGRVAREMRLPHTKLTDPQVRTLRRKAVSGSSPTALSQQYGISAGYVSELVRWKYRRHA